LALTIPSRGKESILVSIPFGLAAPHAQHAELVALVGNTF
jgi:hypothetical protein